MHIEDTVFETTQAIFKGAEWSELVSSVSEDGRQVHMQFSNLLMVSVLNGMGHLMNIRVRPDQTVGVLHVAGTDDFIVAEMTGAEGHPWTLMVERASGPDVEALFHELLQPVDYGYDEELS